MRDAERRAWAVVKQAYEDRVPAPAPRRPALRIPLALVGAAVAIAAVATPPGHAVFQKVREAVGVAPAEPALFSLPGKGRLLVVSAARGGVWLVHDNGLKRRIGSYDDAQWSPHGLFVVATTRNALVALDLDRGVRWSLPRPGAHAPRWEGSRVDTRIAYLTAGGLRIVAGDGTGDRLLDPGARGAPPAWAPSRRHVVAYVARGAVVLREADSRRVLWRRPLPFTPAALTWSSDGRLLAARSRHAVVTLGGGGKPVRTVTTLSGRFADAAFEPGSHRLALSLHTAAGSEVRLVDADRPGLGRLLFAGPGSFDSIVWSPDGRWLLVGWPTADQWVFLQGSRVHAVANIREQFPRGDGRAPSLQFDSRWCCSR